MFKMSTLKEEKKEPLGLGLGCGLLPGSWFSGLCSQSKAWWSSSTVGVVVLKKHSFCPTLARGEITAEKSTRALEMVIRKMPRASIWMHPDSPSTFPLKRMPSPPSILARLWAEKALLKHLILLLIFISWRDNMVSGTWITDFLIWRVEGKVCLCYLPPNFPFIHYSAGFRTTWGLDSDVTWFYLKSICGVVVRCF